MLNRIPASARFPSSAPANPDRETGTSSSAQNPQAQASAVQQEQADYSHLSLPHGWEQSHHEQSGQTLYTHTKSQHSQTERPYPLLPGWKEVIRKHQGTHQLYYFNASANKEYGADMRPEFLPELAHLTRTEIEPNRTNFPRFLFNKHTSWGCERRAATIEGSTNDFRIRQDIEAMCIRLLQTDKSAMTYTAAVSVEAFFSLAHLALYASGRGSLFNAMSSAAGVMSAIPHYGVSGQYSAVNKQCREYLSKRFDDDFVSQLEKQSLNKEGINNIISLLAEYEPTINTLKLETLLDNEEQNSNQNMLDKLFDRLWQNFFPEVNLDPV